MAINPVALNQTGYNYSLIQIEEYGFTDSPTQIVHGGVTYNPAAMSVDRPDGSNQCTLNISCVTLDMIEFIRTVKVNPVIKLIGVWNEGGNITELDNIDLLANEVRWNDTVASFTLTSDFVTSYQFPTDVFSSVNCRGAVQ